MHFADPMKVTCPGCGSESPHSIASLKALIAECPACHRTLRETGEQIVAFERGIGNGVIAMGIILAIEELNERINIHDRDVDYEGLMCLDDVIALADEAIATLPQEDRLQSGADLVEAAIKEMVPSIAMPARQTPLIDAFGQHLKEMNDWHWHGRRARKSSSSGT